MTIKATPISVALDGLLLPFMEGKRVSSKKGADNARRICIGSAILVTGSTAIVASNGSASIFSNLA